MYGFLKKFECILTFCTASDTCYQLESRNSQIQNRIIKTKDDIQEKKVYDCLLHTIYSIWYCLLLVGLLEIEKITKQSTLL